MLSNLFVRYLYLASFCLTVVAMLIAVPIVEIKKTHGIDADTYRVNGMFIIFVMLAVFSFLLASCGNDVIADILAMPYAWGVKMLAFCCISYMLLVAASLAGVIAMLSLRGLIVLARKIGE